MSEQLVLLRRTLSGEVVQRPTEEGPAQAPVVAVNRLLTGRTAVVRVENVELVTTIVMRDTGLE